MRIMRLDLRMIRLPLGRPPFVHGSNRCRIRAGSNIHPAWTTEWLFGVVRRDNWKCPAPTAVPPPRPIFRYEYNTDVNVPIGSGDTPVFPGDIIVGDADGVIVIPAGIVEEITTDAIEMTAYEEFVTEPVRAGQKTLGLYPPTNQAKLDAFAVWRKKHGR
jgi:Aldolase/RraA